MKCLVTGATGFVGSRLVPQLAGRGHDVLAYSKTGRTLPEGVVRGAVHGVETGVKTVALDLASEVPSREVLAGVDVVIHLAGIAHQRAQPSDYEALVVEATKNLAQEAACSGVQRFIFLSSVKAMGAPSSPVPRTETQCNDQLTPYGAAKRRAEESLLEIQATTSSMALSILRPALIYGGAMKGNLALLEKAARMGLPRPPDVGRRSMVGLPALLNLISALVEGPPHPGQVWNACDDDTYSAAQIYDLLRASRGLSARKSRLPLWLWRLATIAADIARGGTDDTTYERLFGVELYSNEAVREATGWAPGSGLAEWAATLARASGTQS